MTVMHAMLGNAALAAGLALVALGVGRVCRSPAVRHVAWVLVLLKLVTPPVVSIPLPVLPASWESPSANPRPLGNGLLLAYPSAPTTRNAPAQGDGSVLASWDLFRLEWIADGAFAVWVVGALVWFIWQGRRILRFRRRVARAEDVAPEIAAAARRIAAALGIAHPPAVKAANGIGSPMLWGWGRKTVVLVPRELFARLAPEARDTLLAHELAHFLRRDHWVRVLEFVATGLYWWHPAVWLARAGIEVAEEECCDAWVVAGLGASPRRYAEALLATVDYVGELRRPCLPPGACAATNRGARLLHRRLVGIIHAKRPSRLPGGFAVRAAVVVGLLVQPVLIAATPAATEPPSDPVVATKRPRPPSPQAKAPPKPKEPRSWATATAPGGAITVVARDNEVLLRRPNGTDKPLGPGRPLALAFAPDGKRLATAGPGSLVRTWDDRGCSLNQASLAAAARAVAYTPDGTRLLVLDAAGGISVRHPDTLAPLAGWSVEGPANSIACSPDGSTVAVSFGSWLDETGWVECWSIAERQKVVTYKACAPVGATRFAPDGRVLVLGGWNGLLMWRTLPNGEVLAERQLPKDLVASAAFSPDAGTLPLEPPPEPEPIPLDAPLKVPDLIQGLSQLPKR